MLNEADFLVIVVSNQSGVARGYYQEKEVEIFNNEMQRQLSLDNARIDGIYYCPHHPDGVDPKYKKICSCRKPKPGMLISASQKFQIDFSRSFIVGDKWSDIIAGFTVQCKGILVLTGHGLAESEHEVSISALRADNLLDAVTRFII